MIICYLKTLPIPTSDYIKHIWCFSQEEIQAGAAPKNLKLPVLLSE